MDCAGRVVRTDLTVGCVMEKGVFGLARQGET